MEEVAHSLAVVVGPDRREGARLVNDEAKLPLAGYEPLVGLDAQW